MTKSLLPKLARVLLLLGLIAIGLQAQAQQPHYRAMWICSTEAPYVYLFDDDDDDYNNPMYYPGEKLTHSIITSDGRKWWYYEYLLTPWNSQDLYFYINDGKSNDVNDGSHRTDAITLEATTQYYYYNYKAGGAPDFYLKLTDLKNAKAYAFLQPNSNVQNGVNWDQAGATFKAQPGTNTSNATGDQMNFCGGYNGDNNTSTNAGRRVFLWTSTTPCNETKITFKRCSSDGNTKWNAFYNDYAKGGFYENDKWDGGYKVDDQYENLILPYGDDTYTLAESYDYIHEGNQYVIADNDLTVVHADMVRGFLFCKDNNAYKYPDVKAEGHVDYMCELSGLVNKNKAYDQSNWIMLSYEGLAGEETDWVGYKLKNVKGVGTSIARYGVNDDYNDYETYLGRCLELSESPVTAGKDPNYKIGGLMDKNDGINTYIPANFDYDNIQTGLDGNNYFFVTPKEMEVVDITWAVWDADKSSFCTPASGQEDIHGNEVNSLGFTGAMRGLFGFNDTFSSYIMDNGEPYQFRGLILKCTGEPEIGPSYVPRHNFDVDPNTQPGEYAVAMLNMPDNTVITAVKSVKKGRQPVAMEYVNVAGQRANTPFEGVNLVVTHYNDGTTTTRKVIL